MMLDVVTQVGQAQKGQTSAWTVDHVRAIAGAQLPTAPIITEADILRFAPDLVLWDIWPVQLDDGQLASVAGGSLWIMLSAPRTEDPDDRHDRARMRLLQLRSGNWHDCGPLLPDDLNPGWREWSGSTRLDPDTGAVTLWYTVAGRKTDAAPSFEQRLFQLEGQLDLSAALPRMGDWTAPRACVNNDGTHYVRLDLEQGVPGRIKGFRDPYWFRDPADGQGYVLFTGSKPAHASRSLYDGVIGIARANDVDGLDGFTLLPSLVDGDGLTNELERPHVIVHNGLYYLFWSTQSSVFAPDAPPAPTGLYGMVSSALFGPWKPLNGTGLVLANPEEEPRQAYAWQVLPSLDVISFVDYWGLEGRDLTCNPALKAERFGGTIAPMIRIALDRYTSRVEGLAA